MTYTQNLNRGTESFTQEYERPRSNYVSSRTCLLKRPMTAKIPEPVDRYSQENQTAALEFSRDIVEFERRNDCSTQSSTIFGNNRLA